MGARTTRRAGNRLQLQIGPCGACQPQPDGYTHVTGASLVTGRREDPGSARRTWCGGARQDCQHCKAGFRAQRMHLHLVTPIKLRCTQQPTFCSMSAASRQGLTMLPYPKRATSLPPRRMTPFPTSRGVPFRVLLMPAAARSTPMPLPLGNLQVHESHFLSEEPSRTGGRLLHERFLQEAAMQWQAAGARASALHKLLAHLQYDEMAGRVTGLAACHQAAQHRQTEQGQDT